MHNYMHGEVCVAGCGLICYYYYFLLVATLGRARRTALVPKVLLVLSPQQQASSDSETKLGWAMGWVFAHGAPNPVAVATLVSITHKKSRGPSASRR